MAGENVVVLGASPDAMRYSNKAMHLLMAHGHRVIPVSPLYTDIEGTPVLRTLGGIDVPVHTLTLYLSPKRLLPLIDDIVRLRPGRVIFNPGTETPELQSALDRAGIPWEEACTLVLLRSGQF
ncbi:MAG: CoA-binding protein [Pseudomonadota bacterium]